MVKFIVKAYAAAVFDIVRNPGLEYGPYHFFHYLLRAKECLSEEDWNLIAEYFLVNSYMAHPENLLFSALMCPLSSQEVRERALALILEFRTVKKRSKSKKIRKFVKLNSSEVNFEANNLLDLIKWDKIAKSKKTAPPILQRLSDDELKGLVSSQNSDKIPKLLCHSQVCLFDDFLSFSFMSLSHEFRVGLTT